MAGAGLIALIDDIAGAASKLSASVDNLAVLTAQAGKKTAGVVGDDLALNANQLVGIDPSRELPIVWTVAKGSLKNKAILVPAALLISAVAPWAVTPLLMLGGAFLCFEGVEKLAHRLLHPREHAEEESREQPGAVVDFVELERLKVQGAIRTDFILSAEIVAITLGSVAGKSLPEQFAVLAVVALIMTFGVYGLVGAIVKMDDVGLHLSTKRATRLVGLALLKTAPRFLAFLSAAGTAAMFMVGGGIIIHGIHALDDAAKDFALRLGGGPGFVAGLVGLLAPIAVGFVTGALALPVFTGAGKLVDKYSRRRAAPAEPPPPAGAQG